MNARRWLLAALLLALLPACTSLSGVQRARSSELIVAARSQAVDCDRPDACAQPSALRALAGQAFAESTADAPRHRVLILDHGTDALLARINLIRSATTAIDLQTFIFDEDDAGRLVLDELLAAARRGVRVRLLLDQIAALERVDTLAALAGAHANFEVRVYSPVLGRARISYWQYVVGTACCFDRLNERMHTKLMVVDGAIAITGGRNYQDDYYDWDPEYNFRDRDVLVAGPVARTMDADFARFWDYRRSARVEHLVDVGGYLLANGVPTLPPRAFTRPARAQAMRDDAGDPARAQALAAQALAVGAVEYISDPPGKHRDRSGNGAIASRSLRALIESAGEEVLLQTPYLVLSKPAQQMFRELRQREAPPRVIVSTNSLASTDAFVAYALSYKYKRRYLREFGFEIHEYKPFPEDAPIDLAATGALPPLADAGDGGAVAAGAGAATLDEGAARTLPDRRSVQWRSDAARERRQDRARYRDPLSREDAALRFGSRKANEQVPLKRAGVRIGLHAKSLVVDGRVGVIGTHNFDPRADRYNTESAVVIADAAFAQALAASIRRDIAPANSWTIAKREAATPFTGLEYSLGKASEQLPIFDLWPVRYATSYEFVPGPDCPAPLSPRDPRFRACYRPVGDFPEVDLGLKSLTTRIFTAFGAGLAPIL